jgi:hypothetical protein
MRDQSSMEAINEARRDMADAVSFKYIAAPLSKDQLAGFLLVPLK